MAKGKHANSANAKKLRAAEERISALEDLRARESQEAHEREEALKSEIQRLKGRLLTEVDQAASERVAALEAKHADDARRLREEGDRRVREGLRTIGDNIVGELTLKGPDLGPWESTAAAFGIPYRDLMAWVGARPSRAERRITPGNVKAGRDAELADNPKLRVASVIYNARKNEP